MNGAHLHLLLNHFPLIGFVFSLLILGLGYVRANENFVRVGLLVILVSGVLAAPAYLAGEPAEDVIEKLPGFSEKHPAPTYSPTRLPVQYHRLWWA